MGEGAEEVYGGGGPLKDGMVLWDLMGLGKIRENYMVQGQGREVRGMTWRYRKT